MGESKVGGREEERKVEAKEDAKQPPATDSHSPRSSCSLSSALI